ncbi:PREDICTED: uncharacterized protein LOC108357135 [Rhagoletis zephyria]|uniref:uncharacterized protein LOC108357135 n=1 Tax=Rhagoletis zephyria TaxID=28612 RepID=UPI00081160D6|nr:PREDICTED: uncharacterized protein LOC108357135 [Rhagoletis zephyria]
MENTTHPATIVSRRKSTVWTREKITQLIELYRQHDCLWNHYTEAYKNKEKRTKAIENICSTLRITKMDFGKKIHNLRNQFNSEMKKLERRVEETGDDKESNAASCRWKHFQALRFLRDIIEPRPGGYQSKMRKIDPNLKYDNTSEDEIEQQNLKPTIAPNSNDTLEQITRYHLEEATIVDHYEERTTDQGSTDRTISSNVKQSETPSTLVISNERNSVNSSPQTNPRVPNVCLIDQNKAIKNLVKKAPFQQISQCEEIVIEELHHDQVSRCCHMAKGDQCGQIPSEIKSKKKGLDESCMILRSRDQWDAFGELIATEFRHLNSDFSRRKLKRKIMQAMLEISEEDDADFT